MEKRCGISSVRFYFGSCVCMSECVCVCMCFDFILSKKKASRVRHNEWVVNVMSFGDSVEWET